MKLQKTHLSISMVILGISLISCDKCESCYLIEENDGVRNEIYQGEYCGDDIKKQESLVFNPPSGTAFIECD